MATSAAVSGPGADWLPTTSRCSQPSAPRTPSIASSKRASGPVSPSAASVARLGAWPIRHDGRFQHRPALDLAQAVVLQGRPRAGQVDDDVGDAQARVQLERPFRIDQLVIIDAELAEVLPHQGRVLGRDPEGPPGRLELGRQVDQVHDVADVDPALGHGDGQPAAAVAEVGETTTAASVSTACSAKTSIPVTPR